MATDDYIAKYWDKIQGAKFDYDSLAERLGETLSQRGARRILDLGCGTGTLLLALARMGFECVGIDLNPHMLEEARRKAAIQGLKVDFRLGDMRRLEAGENYDAVFGFQVFSLLRDRSDICLALAGIGDVLAAGGLLVFDVLVEGPETGGENREPPPANPLFIDTALDTGNGPMVRLNRMTEMEAAVQWQAVYFFRQKGQVTMNVRTIPLSSYLEGEIVDMLDRWGFTIQEIERNRAGGPRRLNARIMAVRTPVHKGDRE
jgi:SAM-dependent methyltransferase